ncbi:MAG: hypothetical protein AB1714_28795 [Acidobacteriota bacterium]
MFEWAFRGADFIVHENGEAGSAVNYRTVELPGGGRVRVGIVSGSWTLPVARGRGHFSRILEESREIAWSRGAAMLLSFVTATNASRRRVEASGATMVPAFYCRGTGRIAHVAPPAPSARFVYTETEWRMQFLERPRPTKQLRTDAWAAVIEEADGINRVHFIDGDFAAAISALGRLFCYTTIPSRARALADAGFEIIDGFVGVMPIRGHAAVSEWDIQNGDRM